MIKECVIKDGRVINIGTWDECRVPIEVGPAEFETVEISPAKFDEEGNLIEEAVFEVRTIKEAVYEDLITNPFPEGATIEERDFEDDHDRGWFEVGTEPPKTPQQEIEELKQLVAALSEKVIVD